MFNYNHIEDFIDNRIDHEDYYTLIEEYNETEIYKEIIHFMYLAFPDWTSNNGIGGWAAEFVLTSIRNLEHVYEDEQMSSSDKLKDIYTTLVDDYDDFKSMYSLSQGTRIVDVFEYECECEIESISHLEKKSYDLEWDKLFEAFKKDYLARVIYDFRREEEVVIS